MIIIKLMQYNFNAGFPKKKRSMRAEVIQPYPRNMERGIK